MPIRIQVEFQGLLDCLQERAFLQLKLSVALPFSSIFPHTFLAAS